MNPMALWYVPIVMLFLPSSTFARACGIAPWYVFVTILIHITLAYVFYAVVGYVKDCACSRDQPQNDNNGVLLFNAYTLTATRH
jgi:hypothetical protein